MMYLLRLATVVLCLAPALSWSYRDKTEANDSKVKSDNDQTRSEMSPLASMVQLGPYPYYLLNTMKESSLKSELESCAAEMRTFEVTDFSIGHRGACMQFPEHTEISYTGAAHMGAGIIECDVTFTSDLELVCRHAQCDLHTTTDIVTRPELNAKCTTPWSPSVTPQCCTSDFTLAELKTLCAKMDSSNDVDSETPEGYAFGGTADWRTDLYSLAGDCPRIPTHKESIAVMQMYGRKYTPELKEPTVEMPFNGEFSQNDFAQKLVDEFIEAGVSPEMVWIQSAVSEDIVYLTSNTDFGSQVVALDFGDDRARDMDKDWLMEQVSNGANYVAPPMWKLVEADLDSELGIVPSQMAIDAKEMGLKIITWTLDRTSPPLEKEGAPDYYWMTLQDQGLELTEGSRFELLHVLAQDVGIEGIFDDWPAVTTFYANCMGLGLQSDM